VIDFLSIKIIQITVHHFFLEEWNELVKLVGSIQIECKTNNRCWQLYLNFQMTIRIIILSTLVLISLVASGQEPDSVSIDLKRLTDLNFFKKYSFYDDSTTETDMKVTKLIWSLKQVREINKGLRHKGVQTLTRIDIRPTNEFPYYLVGHYQLPTKDHITRMAYYRVDPLLTRIDYQDMKDFVQDKWKKIN
jgi:hypothetical protein